jgi:hypothetical protein
MSITPASSRGIRARIPAESELARLRSQASTSACCAISRRIWEPAGPWMESAMATDEVTMPPSCVVP